MENWEKDRKLTLDVSVKANGYGGNTVSVRQGYEEIIINPMVDGFEICDSHSSVVAIIKFPQDGSRKVLTGYEVSAEPFE